MKDPFYSKVDEMFKNNSSVSIYNSNKAHAQYIINKIFQKARKEVTIYAGGNDFFLYNNQKIKDTIKSKKLNFSIIVDTEKDAKNFSRLFLNEYVRVLNRNFSINLEDFVSDLKYGDARHFLVADKKYTRIEKPHTSDSNEIKSVAFVNNKNLAKLLTKFGEYLIAYKE